MFKCKKVRKVRLLIALGLSALTMGAGVMSGSVAGASPVAVGHEIKNPDNSPMVVHWAVLTSTPGQMKKMGAYAAQLVGPKSMREEGTYMLYGCTPTDNPDVNILLEVYRSEADYELHVGSKEFAQYEAARRPILRDLHFVYTEPIVMMSKDPGLVGTAVRLTYVEPEEDQVDAYRQMVKEEYTRAVNYDDGVLVMVANNELGNPGRIHSYLLFRDKSAEKAYYSSEAYEAFANKAKTMLKVNHHIDGAPTRTTISSKPGYSIQER